MTVAGASVVLLCRGCCCGTTSKHPRTDHAQQLAVLAAAVANQDSVTLRVVDCLDECDRSNVAVVRKAGAAAKDRDTWLGGLLTPRATDAFADWLADGADGALPAAVAGLRFRHFAPRKGR
ncbi:MAG: hypothetical protein NVS3B26_23740 [Mycobacteriales bacterium]